MFKQPKKYYRYHFSTSDRRRKAGFHREIALSCSEEHHALIRSKRDKRALFYYSDFSYDREAEPNPDQLSWKHRCKKRHQWVKHHYSWYEMDIFLAWRCREHRAHELLKLLQKNLGWMRLELRSDPMLEAAVRHLRSKLDKLEIKEYGYGGWYEPSFVDVRLKQENEADRKKALISDEIARGTAFLNAVDKREKNRNKRLPISHKYIRDKFYLPLLGLAVRRPYHEQIFLSNIKAVLRNFDLVHKARLMPKPFLCGGTGQMAAIDVQFLNMVVSF